MTTPLFPAPVLTGYVVVERVKNSRGKTIDKIISGRFTVKSSAEQFVDLAKQGERDVFLREVFGSEAGTARKP